MILSAIVAAGEDNAIGRNNDLLWRLPDDMRFFKETTLGHAVIMGRKTLESFRKPLPNRENIVISRNRHFHTPGIHLVASVEEALQTARSLESTEAFLLGGGEIYRLALPLCDRVYLTRVHARFPDADTWFPELDPEDWTETRLQRHETDERHAYAFTIFRYDRIK